MFHINKLLDRIRRNNDIKIDDEENKVKIESSKEEESYSPLTTKTNNITKMIVEEKGIKENGTSF